MRREVLVVGITSLIFTSASFAQQQEKPNPNVERMQQMLNQASSQASEQFNKTFVAPSATGETPSSPPVVQPMSPPPKVIITTPEQTSSTQSSSKIPDVAVNSDKSSGQSVGNIYAAGGGSQNGDSNSGSINPYR